jgi:urease accessory protein
MVAALLITLLLLLPSNASDHSETGAAGGLISGFLHPLTGLDHVVAMVAVGLWEFFLELRLSGFYQ